MPWKRNFIASAASCIRIDLRAAEQNEKEWSLADTALLNDAYRTLKDPIHRTEYLLKLHGAEIGEEHGGEGKDRRKDEMGASRVPADLLEEVFDLNMQLEEMRMAHKMGEEDPALKQSLSDAKKKFEGLRDAVDQDLARAVERAGTKATRRHARLAQKTMVALAGPAALSQQPGARCNRDARGRPMASALRWSEAASCGLRNSTRRSWRKDA